MDITNTNFREGLNKEGKEIQRELLRRRVIKEHKCDISEIKFLDEHSNVIDDVLDFRGKQHYLEYKMDYRAHLTGNLVFELITYLPLNCYPNIQGFKFYPNNPNYPILLDLINNVKDNKIDGAKISRHIRGESFDYLFIYSVSTKLAQDLKSVDDICMRFVFNGATISNYVKENYNTHPLIVTKTDGEWYTVSMLTGINEVENLCSNKKDIYL